MIQKIKEILEWFNSKKIRQKLIFVLLKLVLIQAIMIFIAYLAMRENTEQTTIFILAITIVSIISLCLISVFSYIYIVKPIEKLMQYINMLKLEGDGCIELFNQKRKEILKDTKRLVEVDKIIDEAICKEREIKKLKFHALQESIKPHFLYNTLSSIAAIALENSDEKTYDAIMTLRNYYREFLSKGKKEISLREEIEMVKNYLKIQKLRFGDMFEAEYEIDENLLDIIVPKLILQPLVENSLYHGIRLKGEKGIIKISVYKEKRIHLVVFDTGVGMSEKQLKEIMSKGGKESFGLKGTINRIQYYYNDLDLYEITTKEGLYFKIDIKIPM
jgi:two-component system sensor histidine kinase YesM